MERERMRIPYCPLLHFGNPRASYHGSSENATNSHIDKFKKCAILFANDSQIKEVTHLSSYSTAQRKAMLAFLEQHPDELLSAQQIAAGLKGETISQSAVYRNLAILEQEEKVRRCSKSGSRTVFYQYIDSEHCRGALHMTCLKCGRTFHMAQPNAELFARHLAQSEAFTLNPTDTVLYGTCGNCKNH